MYKNKSLVDSSEIEICYEDDSKSKMKNNDWKKTNEKRYLTAGQVATASDRHNASLLLSSAKQIVKRRKKLVKLIPDSNDWCEISTFVRGAVFWSLVLPDIREGTKACWNLYHPETAKVVLYLLSESSEEWLRLLENKKDKITRGRRDNALEVITNLREKLDQGYDSLNEGLKYMFWKGEYSKRQLLLRMAKDDVLKNNMELLRFFLQKSMDGFYRYDDFPCETCPFSFSEDAVPLEVNKLFKEGVGCGNRTCSFSAAVTNFVFLNIDKEKSNFVRPRGFEMWGDDAIRFCVDVSLEFGLCAHELYSICTPTLWKQYYDEYARWPEMVSLLNLNGELETARGRTIITTFSKMEKVLKSQLLVGNDSKLNKIRMVGLRLWDLKNLTFKYHKSSFSTLVRKILCENWYKECDELFLKYEDYGKPEVSNRLRDKSIDHAHWKYYVLTNQCITHSTLFNMQGAFELLEADQK